MDGGRASRCSPAIGYRFKPKSRFLIFALRPSGWWNTMPSTSFSVRYAFSPSKSRRSVGQAQSLHGVRRENVRIILLRVLPGGGSDQFVGAVGLVNQGREDGKSARRTGRNPGPAGRGVYRVAVSTTMPAVSRIRKSDLNRPARPGLIPQVSCQPRPGSMAGPRFHERRDDAGTRRPPAGREWSRVKSVPNPIGPLATS
jgi:hypothetical protein